MFFLALASAYRVSELHGLSAEHSFDEFTIPALLDFVGEDEVTAFFVRFGRSVSIFAELGIVDRPALGCWSQFRIPDELSTLISCLSGFVR
ncbi:hypothetical protein E2C01_063932 [Portunus trituberculatus]|uniref:Uncharacterized protein n=1 Tax=Portunus trituberculatus TaxID=210409 RepID=A0A5B7HAF9_PORTR|nr:hypothetical protein [Portunus trituberculatus]